MPFKDEEKRKASHAASKRKQYQRNKEFINSKKIKCAKCGYCRCKEALEFHHLDPTQKDFSSAGMKTRSIQRIQEEIDKCVVLCANCHREAHLGL